MKPYYKDGAVTVYHASCFDVLPLVGTVDHLISDPPYGQHTHAKQWIGSALTAEGASRVSTAHKELGFAPITPDEQERLGQWAARSVRRWTLLFTDLEGIWGWRAALIRDKRAVMTRTERSNAVPPLDYVRACIWDKVDGAPQFTGDRPAAGAEAIICAHPSGAKRWNGGGKRGVYRHAVNGERGGKPHPSTKPEALMSELISDFTDAGDIIVDPFAGSGTTGVAAKRLGRRCILIEQQEKYCDIAASRLSMRWLEKPGGLFHDSDVA